MSDLEYYFQQYVTQNIGILNTVSAQLSVPSVYILSVIGEEAYKIYSDGPNYSEIPGLSNSADPPMVYKAAINHGLDLLTRLDPSGVLADYDALNLNDTGGTNYTKLTLNLLTKIPYEREHITARDVGIGGENIGASVYYLKQYLTNNPSSDPLNIKAYQSNDYGSLAFALASSDPLAIFAIAGLIVKAGLKFYTEKFGSNFTSLSSDKQAAYLDTYYKIGEQPLSNNATGPVVNGYPTLGAGPAAGPAGQWVLDNFSNLENLAQGHLKFGSVSVPTLEQDVKTVDTVSGTITLTSVDNDKFILAAYPSNGSSATATDPSSVPVLTLAYGNDNQGRSEVLVAKQDIGDIYATVLTAIDAAAWSTGYFNPNGAVTVVLSSASATTQLIQIDPTTGNIAFGQDAGMINDAVSMTTTPNFTFGAGVQLSLGYPPFILSQAAGGGIQMSAYNGSNIAPLTSVSFIGGHNGALVISSLGPSNTSINPQHQGSEINLSPEADSLIVGPSGGGATVADATGHVLKTVIVSDSDNNTLIANNAGDFLIGNGNNNTFVDNTSLASDKQPVIMIGGAIDGSVSTGDTFIGATDPANSYIGNQPTDIMIGSAGQNTFTINSPGSRSAIIWGGGGQSTYNINDPNTGYSNTFAQVYEVYINNPTVQNVSKMTAADLISIASFESGITYPGLIGDNGIIIINPSVNDTLNFNGHKLSAASYGVNTFANENGATFYDFQDSEGGIYSPGPGIFDFETGQEFVDDQTPGKTQYSNLVVIGFTNGDFGISITGNGPEYTFLGLPDDGQGPLAADPTFFSFNERNSGQLGAPTAYDSGPATAGNQNHDVGRSGNDSFIFNPGYGQLEITEDAKYYATSSSVLRLGIGIISSQLTITGDALGNIYLSDGIGGDQVKLDGELNLGIAGYAEFGVAQVQLADGTLLTRQQLILAATTGTSGADRIYGSGNADILDGMGAPDGSQDYLQGNGGADTFVFDAGYGQLEIHEDAGANANSSAMLQLGVGITASQIVVTEDGVGNLYLTNGIAGDQIKLDGELNQGTNGYADYGISRVQFVDGTSLTRQQLVRAATTGTSGADKIYGTRIADILDGKGAPAGSQDYLQGNGGADTFVFKPGYGQLEVNEDAGYYYPGAATLQVGGSLTASQITITGDSSGDVFLADGITGDQVKLDRELNQRTGGNAEYGVIQVQFADGTILTQQQMATAATTGTAGADQLYGTSNADILDGKGAPAGSRDYLQGNGGADTFVFKPGYGQLEVNEDAGYYYPSTATLQVGGSLTASQITITSDSSGDVYLTDGIIGDQVKLDGELNQTTDDYDEDGVVDSNAEYGVVQVQFADGTILTQQQMAIAATTGTAGADQLYGTSNADILDGKGAPAGSHDYLQGNGGADTFVFNPGYGQLEVNEDAGYYHPSTATLQLGAGITAAQLIIGKNSSGGLFLNDGIAGDEVQLDGETTLSHPFGYYGPQNAEYGVAQVIFADGTSLSGEQLIYDATIGNTAADNLHGTSGADTLDGKGAPAGSEDYEEGGGGGDTFVYNQGYGQLEINEQDSSGSNNVLQLGSGITASTITVTSDGSNNVFIADGFAGDQIKIDRELDNGFNGGKLQSVQFADGTTLSRAQLIERSATAEADPSVYVFGKGSGPATINANGTITTIKFGAGISASDLTFQADDAGDLTILVDGNPADSLTISGDLYYQSGVHSQVNQLSFADGTSMALDDNITSTWTGTATNTVLTGTFWGSNTFVLGAGGDHVTFAYGIPASSQNTVLFGRGDGGASIDPNSVSGTVQFGAGISASDLTFQADDAGDLAILVDGDPANSLTISRDLYYSYDGYEGVHSRVQLSFAGGTSMALGDNITSTWTGTAMNTVLTGSDWTANKFVLGAGGDQVTFGDGSLGGSTQNTVLFGRGDGGATIDPNRASGTVQFGAGISASDLTFQADDAGDLTILVDGDPASSLTISSDLYSKWGVYSEVQLSFADGTSMAPGDNITSTWTGTATNTVLTGTGWGPNAFVLGAGGDQVTFGNGNRGGSNQNTVLFEQGDGGATIDPNGVSGTIKFGAGISASDLTFQADDAGDLTILVDGNPADSLTISGDLYYQSGVHSQVNQLSFADGTSMALDDNITSTWTGTATNTVLTGTFWGSNTFVLGAGGDHVTFAYGIPASSQNTVLFGRGDGGASIDPNSVSGTVQFGAGISASDLTFQADDAGDLAILVDGDPANSLTISRDLYYSYDGYEGVHSRVQLSFADGTSMALGDNITSTWTGTAMNTVLTGSDWTANKFVLGAGGDQVTFGDGSLGGSTQNTVLFGRGDGGATIDPNRASGTVQFTEEFTTSSLWLSHSGNDLIVSAFGSADTLNIKDWFSETPQSWSVVTANGFTVDSHLGQLIQAMDTYTQETPGFDPMKATAMPTDPQLQSALTAAWHT